MIEKILMILTIITFLVGIYVPNRNENVNFIYIIYNSLNSLKMILVIIFKDDLKDTLKNDFG